MIQRQGGVTGILPNSIMKVADAVSGSKHHKFAYSQTKKEPETPSSPVHVHIPKHNTHTTVQSVKTKVDIPIDTP
jgi:hypothetical protein